VPEGPCANRGALADLILKLAGEVRQQLGLQLAISRTLVDLQTDPAGLGDNAFEGRVGGRCAPISRAVPGSGSSSVNQPARSLQRRLPHVVGHPNRGSRPDVSV
jgi:hypothetical protein